MILWRKTLSHFFSLTILYFASVSSGQDKAQPAKALPEPDRQIEYKAVGTKSLKLHVFGMDGRKSETADSKKAAIVFFFGGGWTSGTASQFFPQAKHLADLGMVAFCADYRVRSRDGAEVVDCVADAQDALAFVRSHSEQLGVDPNKIVAAGGSAGGHLAASCATLAYRGQANHAATDYAPNALVLFNPALILAVTEADPKSSQMDRKRIEALAARFGAAPEQMSPYHQLKDKLPPTLILHGKADTTVPYKTVELFTAKAKDLGADCRLVGYEGQQHGFFNSQRNGGKYEVTRDEMVNFLRELGYLKSGNKR